MSKLLLPPPLKPKIISASSASGTSSTFHVTDEQKRWVVVGICLHRIILPQLRTFLKPEMQKHYKTLTTGAMCIHNQTYPTHVKKDKSANFNYGSINNNEKKKNVKSYNYNVKDAVDLAKLYLKPFMAKFTAFDDTCDLSAVLGIISSASIFSTTVQNIAINVRKEVRNEWGHCNFTLWDDLKFARCFQLMDSLLRCLSLTPAEEKSLTDDLHDWENKGLELCLGHIVDKDLIVMMEKEILHLTKDFENFVQDYEEEVQKVSKSLGIILLSIKQFKDEIAKKITSIEESQNTLSSSMSKVNENVSLVAEDVKSLKENQVGLNDDLSGLQTSQEHLKERMYKVEENQVDMDAQLKALKSSIDMKSGLTMNDTFQAPNRIPCFCGREKELTQLGIPLASSSPPCKMSAICGLGGTGKTSLAIEHVWRNKDTYKSGVFWISGESSGHFEGALTEMARQVGTLDDNFKKTLSKTLHWLQTREERWCVVIDNLDEYDIKESVDMMKFLCGHWQRSTPGHIIVTTRRDVQQIQEDIPDVSSSNCIELKNLTEQESITFLSLKTEISTNSENIRTMKDLCSRLGYLPLALDQAAAYIRNTKIRLQAYLKEYEKQKLKILKRFKAHYPAQDTSTQRIAVQTTWQLNFDYVKRLSDDYGIGEAASLVMEVSAFLSPDDIPLVVINEGLPKIDNKDLHDCLSSEVGVIDIVNVLTRFSLFQRFTDSSLSVHRLVQDVIRSKMSKDDTKRVLQYASAMLHHAFNRTESPERICKTFQGDSVFIQENPPSLYLWGKLGANVQVFLEYLFEAKTKDDSLLRDVIANERTACLLNEASLYRSACRQTAKALELQTTKLDILSKLDTTEEMLSSLNYFHIPLKDVEFKLISHCLGFKEKMEEQKNTKPQDVEIMRKKASDWREKGNVEYKKQKYVEAIDCYSMALKLNLSDHLSLSNRALCYLKIDEFSQALDDCERCLEIEKRYKKALQRKAWALHELAKEEIMLKGKALASAAVAAFWDPSCYEDKRFKSMFPHLYFTEICNSSQLIGNLFYPELNQTLLFREGFYDLEEVIVDNDLQLVAVDDNVSMTLGINLEVVNCSLYVEGIKFLSGGGLCVSMGSLTMSRCYLSNGLAGCEDFPDCIGGDGCKAHLYPARKICNSERQFGEPDSPSGVPGFPGVQIIFNSSGYFENCDFEGCGGGGLLCADDKSKVFIKGCKVHGNRQSGLEAREGGCLKALDNDVYSNRYHGILIGPKASDCQISSNRIFENCREGIFVGDSQKNKVCITKNRIFHNRGLGVSLQQAQVLLKQNDIFENGFYGIHLKNGTTATVENNDIYGNKCGGIHMGINFSGRFILNFNKIRDHSGPVLATPSIDYRFQKFMKEDKSFFLPEGETSFYSKPPISNGNSFINNDIFHHPKESIKLVENECGFCRKKNNLLKCPRCKIASYCSSYCQQRHWKKHQVLCNAVLKEYIVRVDFKPFARFGNTICIRTFGPHLQGIGEGTKPDPKSKKRFIVKVQTGHLNSHPLQNMTLYDQTTSVDGTIQSPEIFHIIMECGVLGEASKFTSKKAFFYASFESEKGDQLRIELTKLAPYQKW